MKSNLDYPRWKTEHKSILENLGSKNIMVLFSGGRDSSVALDLISKAGQEFGFDFTAHTAVFPVHRYTDSEKQKIESYWIQRGVDMAWHDIDKTDDDLENSENPCLLCQKKRKKLLNDILTGTIEDWSRLVLIANYSLWDITSYALEHLLSNVFLANEQGVDSPSAKRFKETAQRFYPLIRMKEGYTVFRPLIKYNNDDIKRMLKHEGIPFIATPCQYGEFRPKRILEKYYEKMGLRFNYNRLLAFAEKSLDLPDISVYRSMDKEKYLLDIF